MSNTTITATYDSSQITTENTAQLNHSSAKKVANVENEDYRAMAKIIGPDAAKKVLAHFDPTRKTPFPKSFGGAYTRPVIFKSYQIELRNVLNKIYPKINSEPALVWHSTNYETNRVWIGVPHSVPLADRAKHSKDWRLAKEANERKRRQIDRQTPGPVTGGAAPTAKWGAFATQQHAEQSKKAKIVMTSEERKVIMVEAEQAAAKIAPIKIEETFKLRDPKEIRKSGAAGAAAVTPGAAKQTKKEDAKVGKL